MSSAPKLTWSEAYAELRRAQKPGAGVPLYTRYVNRPLGRMVAATGVFLGVTPNQVTMASGFLSALGFAVLIVMPTSLWVAVLSTVLLVIAYVFDSADGQLARVTNSGGPAGEWLDHVIDAGRHLAMHLALTIALYRFSDAKPWMLALPMIFALAGTVRFFALILAEQLRARQDQPAALKPEGGSLAGSLLQLPSDTGVINLVVLLLPWLPLFLVGYGLLLIANVFLTVASLHRRYRELAAPRRSAQVAHA